VEYYIVRIRGLDQIVLAYFDEYCHVQLSRARQDLTHISAVQLDVGRVNKIDDIRDGDQRKVGHVDMRGLLQPTLLFRAKQDLYDCQIGGILEVF